MYQIWREKKIIFLDMILGYPCLKSSKVGMLRHCHSLMHSLRWPQPPILTHRPVSQLLDQEYWSIWLGFYRSSLWLGRDFYTWKRNHLWFLDLHCNSWTLLGQWKWPAWGPVEWERQSARNPTVGTSVVLTSHNHCKYQPSPDHCHSL